jgi:hypothetical protein
MLATSTLCSRDYRHAGFAGFSLSKFPPVTARLEGN